MSVKRLPLIFSILVGINGCGGVPSGQSAAPSMLPMGQSPSSLAHLRGFAATKWPINHVIIIVQENRTVDNLFNGFPGADTVTTGLTSSGKRVPLLPTGLGPPGQYDPKHGHKDSFLVEFDGGRMDGFDKLPTGSCKSNCPPNLKPYAYVPKTQAEEYWTMAQQYVLGDKMFQTNSGPSFPAHQYLISGTSVISTSSTLLAAENAFNPGGAPPTAAGCDMVPGSSVEAIDPATGIESPVFPCFDHPTLSDSLDKATLTWKYYNAWQPGKGHAEPVSTYWAPTYAINHIRHSDSMKNTITPVTEVLDDIKAGNLATVSWVTPSAKSSDHSGVTDGTGPQWVATVVNTLGQSKYWKDTAIFVTWDDWGGWYDHVAPTQRNAYEFGMRVPLLVISPYAKAGYVSHVQHDFGSLLRFTEENFSLPLLGYADSSADNLIDCFDFSKPPRAFKVIPAIHGADYFKHQVDTGQIVDNE